MPLSNAKSAEPPYVGCGGAGRGLGASSPPRTLCVLHTPSVIQLPFFSFASVPSLMPLYTTTPPHDQSAKMLAARGIYKAVARRGVHTTRVLASTKRK